MKFSPVIALLLITVAISACGQPPPPLSSPATPSMAAETFAATLQPPVSTPTSTPFPTAPRPAPTATPTITEMPPTPTPTSTPGLDRFPEAPATVGWQSLPTPECETLAGALAAQLMVSTTITTSVFDHDLDKATPNTGCQITAATTNQILQTEDGMELVYEVETALTALGWSLDMDSRYGFAAFTEVGADYHKGEGLCRLYVVGHVAQAAICPEGLSPYGCFYELPPEQQLFTVQLTCAQSVP